MAEGSNYDYLFKVCQAGVAGVIWFSLLQVVLIGDSGVGKSYVFCSCQLVYSSDRLFVFDSNCMLNNDMIRGTGQTDLVVCSALAIHT